MRWAYAITILLIVSSHVATASQKMEETSPKELIEVLLDSKKSEEVKNQATQALYRQGAKAIPTLIESVGDKREAGKETYVPGPCYNQPPSFGEEKAQQDPLFDCNKPSERSITVGERCEEILYRIVTPAYSSPYSKGRDKGKMGFDRPFVVKDWKKWWKRHQKESLDQFHTQAKKLIDRYWRENRWPNSLEWR